MAPSAEIAALLFSFLFSFVVTLYVLLRSSADSKLITFCFSNGVLQPFRALGWWRWMYRVSPFTYLIEGVLGQAIGKREINCSTVEFVTVQPPSGLSCSQYLDTFINSMGGYVQNPNATSNCEYCAYRTTDQFLLASFNIKYSHHWRNLGIFMVFIVVNVSLLIFRCIIQG